MTENTALAAKYIAVWNDADAASRSRKIRDLFSADVEYRDPIMQGDGHDGINGLISGVHAQFPGFRFALKGDADGYADKLRFSWALGPDGAEAPVEGSDFVEITDGRISRVIGFLDKVPS